MLCRQVLCVDFAKVTGHLGACERLRDSAAIPRVNMADHAACFETPAPPSSFVGAGKVEKLGDLDTYIVGSEAATSAVLLITDIYGESVSASTCPPLSYTIMLT